MTRVTTRAQRVARNLQGAAPERSGAKCSVTRTCGTGLVRYSRWRVAHRHTDGSFLARTPAQLRRAHGPVRKQFHTARLARPGPGAPCRPAPVPRGRGL